MVFPNNRTVNSLVALGCGGALLIAVLYFQQHLGLEPCYLCITQRVFVALVGVIFLVAALHNPLQKGQKIYAALGITGAIAGGYFSAKQDYLFDVFPALEVVTMLIRGDGNCAKVQWDLFGISMPGWVLFVFLVLAGIGLYQLLRKD